MAGKTTRSQQDTDKTIQPPDPKIDRLPGQLEKLEQGTQYLEAQPGLQLRQQIESRQQLLRKKLEIREEVSTVFNLHVPVPPEQRATTVQEFFSQKKAALNKIDDLSAQISKTYHEFLECETAMLANLKEATALCETIETLQKAQTDEETIKDSEDFQYLVAQEAELSFHYAELNFRWETIFEKLGNLLEQRESTSPFSKIQKTHQPEKVKSLPPSVPLFRNKLMKNLKTMN